MALPSKGAFRSKLPKLAEVSIDIEREKKNAEGETVTDDDGNPQIETITVNLEKALDRLLKAVEAYYIENLLPLIQNQRQRDLSGRILRCFPCWEERE